jgi:hypothetical protein
MNHIKPRVMFTLLCSILFLGQMAVAAINITPQAPKNTASVYDLIIITPDKYTRQLQPLVVHKIQMGIRTKLVTLSDLYNAEFWQGRDNPEKIKYFIKDSIEKWGISYVMLVGDFTQMPIRYVFNADNNTGWSEPSFISELYYADIYNQDGSFSSWDTNNNGQYGEWFGNVSADPDIDLYPDVAVGRLACMNAREVRTMVDKIITYETTAYNASWYHTMVVCAGDTYPVSENPNWTTYEGEVNTQDALDNMTGFTPVKLWTSDGSFTNPRDIFKAVNKGCGFLYFSGHANAYRWSTHPPNSTEWIDGLSDRNMHRFRNRDMLPICIVGGCHNLEFDVTPHNLLTGLLTERLRYFGKTGDFWHYTWIKECWGWTLTKLKRGGSIATIGCTGLGMSKEDKQSFSGAGDFMEPSIFYEIGTNHTQTLGKAWANAITDYLNRYPIDWQTRAAWDYAIDAKTVQQLALFGDPSLRIGGYPPLS